MKNKLSFFVVLLAMAAGCHKSEFDDLGGSFKLQGIAVLYDTLNGIVVKKVCKSTKIFIAYNRDTTGYIYSTTTDDQGKYSFTGIHSDSDYLVYSHVDTGTLKYYGQLSYARNNFQDQQSDTLKVYPAAFGQNGIHLIVVNSSNQPLGNLKAWVFNNLSLFNADTMNGKVFDMVGNPYGVSNMYNIAVGDYYFRIRARMSGILFSGETSAHVYPDSIITVVMRLNGTTNGINLYTYDLAHTPIFGARTYFYRSQVVSDLDSNYQNSIFILTSDETGKASSNLIDPVTYYIKSLKVIGNDSLRYKGTVTIPPDQVIQDTVLLHQ